MREELHDAAVDVALCRDVVPGFEKRQDRGSDCAHARRERARRLHALDRGQRLLGCRIRGIPPARVVAVGGGYALLLVVVGDLECRGLIDRRADRTVLFLQVGRSMDSGGFRTAGVPFHGFLTSSRVIGRIRASKRMRDGRPFIMPHSYSNVLIQLWIWD